MERETERGAAAGNSEKDDFFLNLDPPSSLSRA